MNNYYLLALCFGLMVFSQSCTKDSIEEVEEEAKEESRIRVNVFWKNVDGHYTADADAIIAVFYGHYTMDFAGYEYVRDGVLVKRGDTIFSSQIVKTDLYGYAEIKPLFEEEPVALIIRSGIDKDRLLMNCASSPNKYSLKAYFN
jgi:hypothetical protein